VTNLSIVVTRYVTELISWEVTEGSPVSFLTVTGSNSQSLGEVCEWLWPPYWGGGVGELDGHVDLHVDPP